MTVSPEVFGARNAGRLSARGKVAILLAALCGGAYIVGYLMAIAAQDPLSEPAWWYVVALAVPVALCLVGGLANTIRVPSGIAALLFVALAAPALMTIGLLLLPAIICAVIAFAQASSARKEQFTGAP